MSRAAAQLTTPSRHIFVTPVRHPDGSPVLSSQAFSDQSIQVNRTWNGEIWLGNEEVTPGKYRKKYVSVKCTNSGALFLLMTLYSHGNIVCREMVADAWVNIFEFILPTFGITLTDNFFRDTAHYAIAIRRPPSIFQKIEMDPAIIVDAAMRGEEDIVLNILRADPSYLLKSATVENSVGVKSIRTPLQAAIMANDTQLIEKMKKHFARLTHDAEGNPIDGLTEMKNQLIEIYRVSLKRYCEIQAEKIQALRDQKDQYHADVIAYQEERLKQYEVALTSDNLEQLVDTHHKAQEHSTFNFDPYIQAICEMDPNDPQLADVIALMTAKTLAETAAVIARTGVSPTQTFEARAKPFDELTFVEKLNRFREEFVALMQREVIFNPNHILEGLRQNERIWNQVNSRRIADLNYDKRTVIFSQLVGWTQRKAAEPVKQDIRQGTWYLTEQNEPRRRPSGFNDSWRNDDIDVSHVNSSVIDGVGYKFGLGRVYTALYMSAWRGSPLSSFFKTYVEQKTGRFQNFLRSFGEHAPASVSVVVR